MKDLLKKEKGFTLIEIVLVLAIAGLILVIVFLAVSGAQKSRRDSQRKNDLSRVASQLESYASNNNGSYPTTGAGWTGFTTSTYVTGSNLADPSSGAAYTYDTAYSATPAQGHVSYRSGQSCDDTSGGRLYSVSMGLEQGSVCRDNK